MVIKVNGRIYTVTSAQLDYDENGKEFEIHNINAEKQ